MKRGEIYLYLRSIDPAVHEARLREAELAAKGFAGRIEGLGMITLSNTCFRDCIYCGFSSALAEYDHFRLSLGEVMTAAEIAARCRLRTLILRVPEEPVWTEEAVTEVIRALRSRFSFDLILAPGDRAPEVYRRWQKAGVRALWLRGDTTDPFLYRQLRPSMFAQDRKKSWKATVESGLALASGFLIGLPNQTYETLVEDILFFSSDTPRFFALSLEPFLPLAGSPGELLLKKPENVIVPVDQTMVEKVITVIRLLRPDIIIPLSYPLLSRFRGLQHNRFFRAGANTLLLDFTPFKNDIYQETTMSGIPIREPDQLEELRNHLGRLGFSLSLDSALFPPQDL